MKYAILSDIHANYAALEAVIEDLEECGVQRIICLGDIVGYGPQPSETLALIRRACYSVIAGNHDDAVAKRISSKDFIDLAADAVKRHRAALSREEISYLRSLPYTTKIEHALAAHGDFINPQAFNYVLTESDAAANFSRTAFPILFVGHTHIPKVFSLDIEGNVTAIEPGDITLEDNHRYLINPGSVGYPREALGQCFSSYVIYDSTALTIQYRFLPFTISSVMQRGKFVLGRRFYYWSIAILITLFLLGSVASFFISKYRVSKQVASFLAEQQKPSTDPFVVTNKAITLSSRATHVRPNLRLKNGGPPVILEITFYDDEGHELKRVREEVKFSKRKEVAIPLLGITARFEVRKRRRAEEPAVTRFEPEAFFKPGTTRK